MLSRFSIFFGANIAIILIVNILLIIGFIMLKSAGGGDAAIWANRHLAKGIFCLCIMIAIAKTKSVLWYKYAYHLYALNLIVLIAMFLPIIGNSGGINRWLDLGYIAIQPSEIMKIATVLALARILHDHGDSKYYLLVIKYIFCMILPVYLIYKQPDLGTAILLGASAAIMLFCSKLPRIYYISGTLMVISALPIIWSNMKDYQKKRVLSYFGHDSHHDGGYHAMQSRIAIGSGGLFGKGYMMGTQNRFGFLPVKESDFIFTIICEELGIIVGTFVILLYAIFCCIGMIFAIIYSSNYFCAMLMIGLSSNIFLYVFVNIGMVTGLLPVVGVPLPTISYGGSSMLTMMMTAGILMSVHSQLGMRS